jgi:hypothetical protein
MNGLPGNPTTDSSGNYSASVSSGWSGTVAPALAGYTFNPPSQSYTGLTANQSGQDYVATPPPLQISGNVHTSAGAPVSGVVMNGLPGNPTTDSSGNYSASVSLDWSGTVTPTLSGYTFNPPSQNYSGVTASRSGQDYVATPPPLQISGNVHTSAGAPVSGVVMNGLPGNPTTDSSGNYSASVSSGWSGTVTPTLSGYTLSPPSQSYSGVSANQSGQDYVATAPPLQISGNVHTSGGTPVGGVVMNGLPGNPTTDSRGNYSSQVSSGWSGTVTPTLSGYTFNPPSQSYSGLTANQSGQDYIATPSPVAGAQFLWAKQATGGGFQRGLGSAVDGAGNTYVTGYFNSPVTFGTMALSAPAYENFFLVKYDSADNVLWADQAQATDPGYWQEGHGVAVDGSGNCYVVGWFMGTAGFGTAQLTATAGEIFLVKYDSAGNVLWARGCGGSGGGHAGGVALDGSGNIYIAGDFKGTGNFGSTQLTSAGNEDVFLAKYDPNGNALWARSGGGANGDLGYCVAADSSGNSYVSGSFSGPSTFGGTVLTGSGMFVAKYDASGNLAWAQQNGGQAGWGIGVDAAGNCYVAGFFEGSATFGTTPLTSAGQRDALLVKYDPSGNVVWARAGGGAGDDFAFGASVDAAGNCCIAGSFGRFTPGPAMFGNTQLMNWNNEEAFVAKYDSAGNFQWAIQNEGTGNDSATAYGVALDGAGNASVTGDFSFNPTFGNTSLVGGTGGGNFFVARVTPTVAPTSPTITWQTPPDITYGTPLGPAQLNATATVSGTTVQGTFAYSPSLGVVLSAGNGQTLSATFTPADTTHYSPATAWVSINVLKAPLTVTADSKTRVYGAANPQFTGTVAGVQNGDNITANYNCSATASSPVGTYPIVPALNDPANRLGNYNVILSNGTLAVTPTPTAVTLTLYVHDGSAGGPALSGVRVTGTDGAGQAFDQTTGAAGFVTISGAVGTWQFNASKAGYSANSWSQSITATGQNDAFLSAAPVTSSLDFTTLAGLAGSYGFADGQGSEARFWNLHGVAVDNAGNVYVADGSNNRIRKITPNGAVSTLAAQFNAPLDVAVDGAGNVYVADDGDRTLQKITPDGVVSTLAGSQGSSGSADGTGSAARFSRLLGVSVDGSGNIYVADTDNDTIRKVTPDGVVSTLAGLAGSAGAADGMSSAARFNGPFDVAVDSSGNVYVMDTGNCTVRKITPAGAVSTVAGLAGSSGTADGVGSAARFSSSARGIAVDSAGNVFVADHNNLTIRKITPDGVVSTVGGLAGSSGSADGIGSAARFGGPWGLAVDSSGNVYVGDYGNNTVRKGAPTSGPAPKGVISLSGDLAFGGVTVGTTAQRTLTISNTGSSPLTVASISYPPGFSGDWSGAIGPGGSQDVPVTFAPTSVTAYGNALTVNADQTSGNNTYAISGNGVAAIAVIVLDQSTLNQVYDGSPKAVTASTTPPGLALTITYNGATTPPTAAGTYTVVATVTDPNYTGSAPGTLTVSKAVPTIFWANPADITYGTPLGASQLNASASVAGSFSYSPGTGAVLNAGKGQLLSVTFTPADTADYQAATATVSLNVLKATPVIAWSSPADITYGTALGAGQLDASASVPGSFAYSPANGTVLDAGTNALYVVFTPAETADYSSATDIVSLVVSPAALTVTAADASRACGQANPVFTGTITGVTNGDNITATYSCSATTDSPVGTYAIVPSLVDPNNSETNYTVSLVDGTLTVGQAAPQISIQPTNQSVVLGGSAFFSVSTTGSAPLVYQWQFDGANLAAGTNTTLVLDAVGATSVGSYDVVITNPYGSVTSVIATLSLLVPQPPQIQLLVGLNAVANGQTSPVNFGSVRQGQTGPTITFTVNNAGGQSLTLGTIALPTGYTVTQNPPSTLAPGGQGTFAIQLNSSVVGTRSGSVSISNNDPNNNPFTFQVTGTVTNPAPKIIALGGSLAFGNLTVGTTAQATLTISNMGNATLTVSGITCPPGFSGPWSGTIPAGGSQPATVTFAPMAAQPYGGNVTVNSDATSGVNTIAASGTGRNDTNPPTITVTSPTNGQSLSVSPITVAGTATDNVGVAAVDWALDWPMNQGGGGGVASGTTNWVVNNIALRLGANVITLVAVDESGNSTSVNLTVIYAPSPTVISITRTVGQTLNLDVLTTIGFTYTLEYTDSLAGTNWTSGQSQPGTGGVITFSDNTAAGPARFYRIHVQ